MKIGEVSEVTGFSVQTIRHYEKEHLIASAERSEGNFRLYRGGPSSLNSNTHSISGCLPEV